MLCLNADVVTQEYDSGRGRGRCQDCFLLSSTDSVTNPVESEELAVVVYEVTYEL